jgi:hypothetical protein
VGGMTPPKHFDINEWFIIFAALTVITVAVFLPKRFNVTQIAVVWAFSFFLAISTDHIIAGVPYDMYDIFDSPKYEYFDLFTYLLVYPPVIYIYIYGYDKWRPSGFFAFLYILFWALATTGFEYLATLVHVFKFKGWNHLYSLPTYMLVYVLSTFMLVILRRIMPSPGQT